MIKLNVTNDQTGVSINVKSVAGLSQQEIALIVGIVNKTTPTEITATKAVVEVTKPMQQPSVTQVKDEPKPRPRRIELLGTERSLTIPIGEMIPRVKSYVNCPECHFEGDRWGYQGNLYTKCPECDQKLFNSYATDETLAPDEDGYVYMATSVLRHKEQDEVEG